METQDQKHAHDTTNIDLLRQAVERHLADLEQLRQEVAAWRDDLATLRQDLEEVYRNGDLGDDTC